MYVCIYSGPTTRDPQQYGNRKKKDLPEVRVSGILCKFPTDVSEILSLILLWKNINRKWFD